MKNIWMFNHYATKPDGPKPRSYDLGRQLIKKGDKVTIFASSFSHYKLKEEYIFGKEKSKKENCGGVNFIWLKTFPYKRNNWRRVLNMISFSSMAFTAGI
ncbi:MAG: glycosyltransferase WbuB, partial [Candidatus Nealsonbacteria bacterium]|nr:glycosyltransferase WbuB [Candidatus Nealsonbacteria bacterium]